MRLIEINTWLLTTQLTVILVNKESWQFLHIADS